MLGPQDDWRDPRGGRTIDVHMIHTQHLEGRFDMKPTRTRLMGLAAALSTIAIAAPLSTASAATATPAVARPAATIVGATYTTTAPSTFINTNNQVSPGSISSGNQIAS
jgi:hypothetical protein